MPLRIIIDRDLCQGHGVCTADAPEVFELDEDGTLVLLAEHAPADLRAEVERAAAYCPTGAISLREEE